MDLPDLDQRCTAKTRKGKPCRNRALPGLKRCGVHSASAKAKSSAQNQVAAAHRPDTITEERVSQMETLLRSGSYVSVACEVVGIPYSTHKEWMVKGHDEAAPPEYVQYRVYAQRIDKALAVGEDNLVKAIAGAAVEDWRAAAWMLERKEPDRWGKRSVNAVTVTEPDPPTDGKDRPLATILAQMKASQTGQG